MKITIHHIYLFCTVFFFAYGTINAQVVDDFKSGDVTPIHFKNANPDPIFQNGNGILGGLRKIEYEVGDNPYHHSAQLSITKDVLVSSVGYGFDTKLWLSYGYTKKGLAPLNLNLKAKKNLVIEFKAKSAATAVYVTFWTGKIDRGALSKPIPSSKGKLVFKLPLSQVRKIGETFSLSRVDHIRIQFESKNSAGCNMAIDKIWFE